jgi:YesN/AraC family two-component response regulator
MTDKILVVDDEPSILSGIHDLLQMAFDDCEIFCAENGLKATQLLEHTTVDLIITDILMPEKEGLETITEVREKYPQIKIIAMSGGGKTGRMNFLQMAKELGASAVIDKPFDPSELIQTVRRLLDQDN